MTNLETVLVASARPQRASRVGRFCRTVLRNRAAVLGLALIAGSSNYVNPKADLAALGPAMKLAKSTTFRPEKILSFGMVFPLFQFEGSPGLFHRPWNCGTRFSRNADVPSFLSSVAAQRPK